jgi:predicted RNase H-like HicB family nuclease
MKGYLLPIEIQALEEGGYLATSPKLPGFLVQADTVEEILRLAHGVAQTLIEAMRDKDIPLPPSLQSVEPPFRAELLVSV